jgi:hypothetical protein
MIHHELLLKIGLVLAIAGNTIALFVLFYEEFKGI